VFFVLKSARGVQRPAPGHVVVLAAFRDPTATSVGPKLPRQVELPRLPVVRQLRKRHLERARGGRDPVRRRPGDRVVQERDPKLHRGAQVLARDQPLRADIHPAPRLVVVLVPVGDPVVRAPRPGAHEGEDKGQRERRDPPAGLVGSGARIPAWAPSAQFRDISTDDIWKLAFRSAGSPGRPAASTARSRCRASAC
jgi:hypothetical protein